VSEPARSLLQTLLDEPARFSFDAALAVMMQAAGSGEAIRFHASTGLGFVAADLASVERSGAGFRATTGMLGLTGPSGVLPRSARWRSTPWQASNTSPIALPTRRRPAAARHTRRPTACDIWRSH